MKKATIATVKSFIRKNEAKILINVKSSFDGMTDAVESLHGGFKPLTKKDANRPFISDHHSNPTLGYNGVWFVGGSRDWVQPYDDGKLAGYEVSNACGCWIVAVEKQATTTGELYLAALNTATACQLRTFQEGAMQ